jgi:hypothetical protein
MTCVEDQLISMQYDGKFPCKQSIGCRNGNSCCAAVHSMKSLIRVSKGHHNGLTGGGKFFTFSYSFLGQVRFQSTNVFANFHYGSSIIIVRNCHICFLQCLSVLLTYIIIIVQFKTGESSIKKCNKSTNGN